MADEEKARTYVDKRVLIHRRYFSVPPNIEDMEKEKWYIYCEARVLAETAEQVKVRMRRRDSDILPRTEWLSKSDGMYRFEEIHSEPKTSWWESRRKAKAEKKKQREKIKAKKREMLIMEASNKTSEVNNKKME